MKIKVQEKTYEEVMALPKFKNRRPKPQGKFWRWLMKTASQGELKKVNFHCEKIGIENLGAKEPALYLMNHSSFIDLKIASTLIYPRPYHIVCTLDGFVGKEGLMRTIGCIPTRKFMTDTSLVRDMLYTVKDLKESILLYPEASYTFDGAATKPPESVGKAIKMLKVPVVMIRTFGAFARDPLYNNLQIRQVDVSARMEYVLSPEMVNLMSAEEINRVLDKHFDFDNFAWQKENGVKITEDFRADDLNRVLYKCPHCGREDSMEGKGTTLKCNSCGKTYELTELGELKAIALGEGEEALITEYSQVHDWYTWEREEVRRELLSDEYRMELDVDIIALVDTNAVYRIGEGTLVHDRNGFKLTGCDGKLDYSQLPEASYSLYSDYYWYEIGDMISIGNTGIQYYCFPKEKGANVAKARLATEELYKIVMDDKSKK